MIQRIGNTIIHVYKGHKIEKVEEHYIYGNDIYYRLNNLHFERLKDAKQYIDSQTNN